MTDSKPIVQLDKIVVNDNSLRLKIQKLRSMGVVIPSNYPPCNIDTRPDNLRGFLSEVTVTQKLASLFEPTIVEMVDNYSQRERYKNKGDVDILIHTPTPYYLQVKCPDNVDVRGNSRKVNLDSIKTEIIDRIVNKLNHYLPSWSTFVNVEVELNDNNSLIYSWDYKLVRYKYPTHFFVIELMEKMMSSNVEKKIEGEINECYSQLKEYYGNGIIVPVIDLSWYTHDQRCTYKFVKELFSKHKNWNKIGGVLLLLNKPTGQKLAGLLDSEPRFIGIKNPNAPPEKQLDEKKFNPDIDKEEVYAESRLIITTWPEDIIRCHNDKGEVFIDNVKFGDYPDGASLPMRVQR